MKITGEMLKSERINQKLSVQDVAASLKLSVKIISSIEAGNIEVLPAKTFVRGFVKSYAQLLKMDSDLVLRQFQEEMGTTNPLPKVPPPVAEPNENNFKTARPALKQSAKSFSAKNAATATNYLNSENPKKIVLMISIAAILIVALVISNKIIENFKATPIAIEDSQQQKPIIPEEAPVASQTNTAAVSSDQVGTAAFAASGDATAIAPEQVKAAPTLEEGFKKSSGKPVEVLIEAKKDAELEYAKGNSVHFTPLKLTSNQIQILRSKVGLYLKATDGSAIKINVNGVEMTPTGSNKAIKLTF